MELSAVLVLQLLFTVTTGRVFERCELARELSHPRHHIPAQDVATWVCIAHHESQYDTSAVGHPNLGLFQISGQYWCSSSGVGLACGINCQQLLDDDIEDDVVCARKVYQETERQSGDGFTAWAVYGSNCRGDVSSYLDGCQ